MNDKSLDRDLVVSRLAEDLVGPRSENEKLESRPTDVYLTGILWPAKVEMTEDDGDDLGVANIGEENDSSSEAVKTRSLNKPSIAGLSFSVFSNATPRIRVVCRFASYDLERGANKKNDGSKGSGKSDSSSKKFFKSDKIWTRKGFEVIRELDVSAFQENPIKLSNEESDIPNVELYLRCVEIADAHLVTLTMINAQIPSDDRNDIEASTLFQTSIYVEPVDSTFLVPKPSNRATFSSLSSTGSGAEISDEESGRLLYRNVLEFAVGHVCSAEYELDEEHSQGISTAKHVKTTWIPSAIVEGMDPNGHRYFAEIVKETDEFNPFSTYDLAYADTETLVNSLNLFCRAYEKWLNDERKKLTELKELRPHLVYIAQEHLARCQNALDRMFSSVKELESDERLRRSFQLANLAMYLQFSWDKSKSQGGSLNWRPFQLGFLLLSAPSAAIRDHEHREFMDLLWFPTGGGKTEAYLALIACVAVYRRLSDDPNDHSGVCALKRYTLRLLTTQQFSRSSAMILALEAIRLGRVDVPEGLPLRGTSPFSIGLWVGAAATPNKRTDAYAALQPGTSDTSSPKQLVRCPCCSDELTWSIADANSPVIVECMNYSCSVKGQLPIYTVDEDVYDNRPTLLIGTVDKFAQIVRKKETNKLFSITDGSPPDLIIQDELHLISGPLGSIAGAYETAFDLMFQSQGYKSKVIGSTATIRKAPEQVKALFNRMAFQFPPPAIDHDNFGFAVRDQRPEAVGRRHIGVTTAGRSTKFTLQAVSGSILQTALGAFDTDARRDAYWTLVAYFGSLRELGGALVLLQDVVTGTIKYFADARNERARVSRNVEELTARRTQIDIRKMLDVLDYKYGEAGAVDAVLATNMISVGLDISRLGLMLVNGQPKSIAEYIQATSRVGRANVGGLVVSILNNAKARDRSHFETYCNWHQTLYRDVEATSVTPFASRARDKVLHASLVASIRHLIPEMLDSPAAIEQASNEVDSIVEAIAKRAKEIDSEEVDVRAELMKLLRDWTINPPSEYWNDFKSEKSLLQSAENVAFQRLIGRLSSRAWPTLNSMRLVETETPFKMKEYLRIYENADKQ